MRIKYIQTMLATSMLLLLINSFFIGCGNPEAPKIENYYFEYWDVCEGDGEWKTIEEGDTIYRSPLRARANITDNTAVVNPNLTITSDRIGLDVDDPIDLEDYAFEQSGVVCSNDSSDSYFNCEWTCEKVDGDLDYFQCGIKKAKYFIRGDILTLSVPITEGGEIVETLEWEILVSEASDTGDCLSGCRTLKVYRLGDYSDYDSDDDFLKVEGTIMGDDPADPDERKILFSRSSDTLTVDKDGAVIIKIFDSDQIDADNPPTMEWKSLTKWNGEMQLPLTAQTGYFEKTFQLLYPKYLSDIDSVPEYSLAIEASDVADQKKDSGRISTKDVTFSFNPEGGSACTEKPEINSLNIEVGDDIEIETDTARQTVYGKVSSWAGQIKSLRIRLCNVETCDDKEKSYFIDPATLNIYNTIYEPGYFNTSIELVSDWDDVGADGYGLIDDGENVSNYIEITATDMTGSSVDQSVHTVASKFNFTPPTSTTASPVISILESFPVLSTIDITLAVTDKIRMKVKATDNTGQPRLSRTEYLCHQDTTESPWDGWEINTPRCSIECSSVSSLELNAAGEYKKNSWEWDEMPAWECDSGLLDGEGNVNEAYIPTEEFIIVYRAIEIGVDPVSTSMEVHISPSVVEEAVTYTASYLTATQGPNVGLKIKVDGVQKEEAEFNLEAGETLSIDEITISKINTRLNEIIVFPKDADNYPDLDPDATTTTTFRYDWPWEKINNLLDAGETTLCIGAQSVSGHATLYKLEFAEVDTEISVAVEQTDEADIGLCGG